MECFRGPHKTYSRAVCCAGLVYINKSYSSPQTIKCGVSQGSILGPLLFSICINDLPKASHFKTRLYADDTVLILSEKELDTLNKNVNKELIKVENWLNKNKLSLNLAKTKYMFIKPNIKNSLRPTISLFMSVELNLKEVIQQNI